MTLRKAFRAVTLKAGSKSFIITIEKNKEKPIWSKGQGGWGEGWGKKQTEGVLEKEA